MLAFDPTGDLIKGMIGHNRTSLGLGDTPLRETWLEPSTIPGQVQAASDPGSIGWSNSALVKHEHLHSGDGIGELNPAEIGSGRQPLTVPIDWQPGLGMGADSVRPEHLVTDQAAGRIEDLQLNVRALLSDGEADRSLPPERVGCDACLRGV